MSEFRSDVRVGTPSDVHALLTCAETPATNGRHGPGSVTGHPGTVERWSAGETNCTSRILSQTYRSSLFCIQTLRTGSLPHGELFPFFLSFFFSNAPTLTSTRLILWSHSHYTTMILFIVMSKPEAVEATLLTKTHGHINKNQLHVNSDSHLYPFSPHPTSPSHMF